MRRAVTLGLILAAVPMLGGCGSRQNISLEEGQQLPPAPYGREVKPTPTELLQPPTLAIPERSVELRTRSEKREDDPFDLPPPEGSH